MASSGAPLDEPSQVAPPPSDTTTQEIQLKLKELEEAIFSRSTILSNPNMSPFAPVPTLKARLEELKKVTDNTSQGPENHSQSKLPAINPPTFDGSDYETFCKEFLRFLRLTGPLNADSLTKKDWLIHSCSPKVRKVVEALGEKEDSFENFLERISQVFPKVENSISLRQQLQKIPPLQREPTPMEVEQLLLELETILAKFHANSLSDEEKVLTLVGKLHPQMWKEIRSERKFRPRCETFASLKELLREKTTDDANERYMFSQMMSKPTTSKAFVLDQPASTATSSTAQEPAQGKGQGKGRSHNRGSQSAPHNAQFSQKGKGKGGKGSQSERPPNKFMARITCKYCGKPNHCEDECWTKEKVERKQRAEAKKNQQGRMPQAERSQTTQNAKITDDSNQKKRKIAEINFLKAFYLDSTILGQKLDSIIDTGASISAVSSKFTRISQINPTEAQAIRVGNGDLIHSLGTTDVEVHIGPSLKLLQKCHVLDTNAFECVLGQDFLESQPVNGILLKPARLIVEDQE